MRKLQSSIEKFILSAIIVVVSISVSYFLYSSFYSVSSHIGVKSYLAQADFSNIYGNKTSVFILLKNKTDIGSNVLIDEKITFSNGTSNTISVPFDLGISSQSGSGYLYSFETTNFPTIATYSQPIKISNINILSGNSIIEGENNSMGYTSYYYTKSSLSTLPLYYLNMEALMTNAGVLTPGNGYYYAGSKVAIGEKPNAGYVFNGWDGLGNGNYTGDNQTAIITMNSNISEYAKFAKLIKIYVNSTYDGIPVYINGVLNTTTNGTIYLFPGSKYTISFPDYRSSTMFGARYMFESLQDNCGIPISGTNSTTFIASYDNYNCKFTANYVEQYLLLIDVNSSEGSVTPFGGWYNSRTNVEITATANYGYVFNKAVGKGDGSYSGSNNPFYVTMNSPITENVSFTPIVFVYVKSSAQAVPYSFESNYNVFYSGETNSSFTAISGSTLTLESNIKQINWGERQVINIASSTCQQSGNSVTLPTSAGATCTVYLSTPTTQYLFIMNEFLQGASQSNDFKYGSVYIDNGSQMTLMTSNQTWINAGTNVTFYATNDKAGYAFQDFTGTNSNLNGVSYSGVSGIDSNPVVPVGENQQHTWGASAPPYQSQSSYSNGYNSTYGLGDSAGECNGYGLGLFDCDAPQYIPIHIVMNSPVIENANYYLTKNITGNTVTVVVNYKYYNITESTSYQNSQTYSWHEISPSQETLLSSGSETITISNVTPYSNYSSGFGKEIVYYLGSSSFTQYGSDSFGSNYYYWSSTNEYSYYISNFTSQQLSYMPTEYDYVVNQIISKMESQYPSENIYYNKTITYALNLQLSFTLSGTQVYLHYNDLPSGTIDSGSYYDSCTSGGCNYNYITTSNYFGYSNYFT